MLKPTARKADVERVSDERPTTESVLQSGELDEGLAPRAASRFRERYLPFQLGYEKDEFIAAGGTDAGQAVMAELGGDGDSSTLVRRHGLWPTN